jgi:hypothetical protein
LTYDEYTAFCEAVNRNGGDVLIYARFQNNDKRDAAKRDYNTQTTEN